MCVLRNVIIVRDRTADLVTDGALQCFFVHVRFGRETGKGVTEFEEATGVTLPDISSETRKVLKAGAQNEIPYLKPVDSTGNTEYDGTNEAYTEGASYDGTGRTSGSIAQPDGEGREGIPELLRNPENRGWQGSGANNVAERNSVGGSQVLHGLLTDSPEMQAALERSGATPLELRDTTSDPQLF